MKKVMALLFLISSFSIYQVKAQTTTVSFNFSAGSNPVSGWINVAGDPSLAIRTATDATTGISISSVATTNWTQYSGSSASDGYGATGATFFPTAVMNAHWFQYSGTLANYNAAIPQLIISGLNKDSLYTIKMSSSNITGVNTDPTRYTVTGAVVVGYQDVNTRNNTANGATFNNVAPDATGKVKVYVNTVAGSGDEAADISGLQIIMNHSTTPVPLVAITSPANNDTLSEDNSIVINATASETGGTIQKVEFFVDTTKIGEDLTTPYSFTWTNPALGQHALKAKATDALGNTALASITVNIEASSSSWSTTGNIATNPAINFIGTVDSVRLAFRTKNIEQMSLSPTGNVGIGTVNPAAQLHTTGTVRFSGLSQDNSQLRVLTSDTSGNLAYRNAGTLGLTVGDGLGQTASGSLTLGDSIAGPGPHSFVANRYQYLNSHLYSIGGTVNDPVTKPVFSVYDNGDLTVGTTMDRGVNTMYQSGMRYYSKLGLLQIGGSDVIDTTLNRIVYGPYQGAGIIMNTDSPNTIKGYIMNTFFTGDANTVDTLTRMEDCLIATEHSEFGGGLGKSIIAGWGLTLGDKIGNSIITGDAHTINKYVASDNISGTLHAIQDSSGGSLITGYANKFGGAVQFVAGNHMVNKTPYGSVMGNTNVDFTSLGYTGLRGISVPATIAQYPILAIGNGGANDGSIPSNALTMLFNGRTQINTTGYTHALSQSDVTPKAAFEVVSTNSGVLLPKLSTVQRNAIATTDLQNGLLLYNTDSASFQFYNGSAWGSIGSSSSSGHWLTSGTTTYDSLDNIGIGTSNTHGYKLAVNGPAIFTKVVAMANSKWPDYVFKKEYTLPSLDSVAAYIRINGHLSELPTAASVEKKGIDLGGNQTILLKKIEEMTLYLIQQNKELEALKQQNKKLEEQNRALQAQQERIDRLEKLMEEAKRK